VRVLVDTSVWSGALRRAKRVEADVVREFRILITEHRVDIIGPSGRRFFQGCAKTRSSRNWRSTSPRSLIFLKSHAGAFEGRARDAVQRATAAYEKESGLLGSCFGTMNAFFGLWSGKKVQDWTPAVREIEREVLAKALKIEAAAITELENAPAAME